MNENRVIDYLSDIFHFETYEGSNGNYELISNYWNMNFFVRIRKFTVFIQDGKGAKCSIDSDEDVDTIAKQLVAFIGDVLKNESKTFTYDGTGGILAWPYSCNLAYIDYLKDAIDMGSEELTNGCYGKSKKKKRVKSSFHVFSSVLLKQAFTVEEEECFIEITDDGSKWEMVSLDNTPEGWSTKKTAKVFKSEQAARDSALTKALARAGYSEANGNLRYSVR